MLLSHHALKLEEPNKSRLEKKKKDMSKVKGMLQEKLS
jgi:hypothetical protein